MFKTKGIFTCDECEKVIEIHLTSHGEPDPVESEQLIGWYTISESYQEGEQESKNYCSASCARRALGG